MGMDLTDNDSNTMNAATAWIASLIPKFSAKGALRTIGTMAGALVSHAAFLGFAGSNGQLAAMAGAVLITSASYLALSQRSSK